MEQLAGQYRAVEKRLLAKTKDKTPTPFNNLDKLLDMTHHDVSAPVVEPQIQACSWIVQATSLIVEYRSRRKPNVQLSS